MGISGKSNFSQSQNIILLLDLNLKKMRIVFLLKAFEEIIPEEILAKMNNGKKFYKNYKNSVEKNNKIT